MLEIPSGHIEARVVKTHEVIIEDFVAKEVLVKQFVNEIPSNIKQYPFTREFGLFHEESKKCFQESVALNNRKRGGAVNWLRRVRYVNSLGAQGIHDTQRLVTILENNVNFDNYGDIQAKDLGELVRSLDLQDEQVALDKLGDGFKRLQRLNFWVSSKDFRSGKLAQLLVSLLNIPEPVFEQVYAELDQYKFLMPGNRFPTPLVEIFQKGKLTDEQRRLLEQEELYNALTRSIPIVDTRGTKREFLSLPNLSQALYPQENYLEEFYPYLIDYAALKIGSSKDLQKFIIIPKSFIQGLEFVLKGGHLSSLPSIWRNGWSKKDLYEGVEGSYSHPVTPERINEMFGQIEHFSQDPEKVAWIRQFQGAIDGDTALKVSKIDLYESLYKGKDKLDMYKIFFQSLPEELRKKTKIEDTVDTTEGDVKINYDSISSILAYPYLNLQISNQEERYYMELIREVLNNMPNTEEDIFDKHHILNEECMPLIVYIASHKDQIGKPAYNSSPRLFASLVEGILTSNVISNREMLEGFIKLCDDPENLTTSLSLQYADLFNGSQLRKILQNLPGNSVDIPGFLKVLALKDPLEFTRRANKEQWKVVFGEDVINNFLDALPKQTDEKRNAFTHNEYDRTTAFLSYLISYSGADFSLNNQDIGILTDYIRQFGLSKTPVLFRFFKNLSLFEQSKIDQLPQDIVDSGISSTTEMVSQLKKVKEMVYSENPMTDLANLTTFEIEMLRFITGKSSHRWDSGKPRIEQIIQDFQRDLQGGRIESLFPEYQTETIDTSKIRIEFNEDAIREDYDVLKSEILASIENPKDVDGLKEVVKQALQRKIQETQQVASESEGKKLESVTGGIARFEDYVGRLGGIDNIDSLLVNLFDMNFDKTEQKVINSVFRRIIFSKIFQKHYSPGFIEEMKRQLDGEMSAGSIESILNIVDEMAKTHALNLEGNNKEGYWSNEVFAKIKGSKRGRDLPHSFSPHIGKLREEVEKFQKIQIGGSNTIRAIPDRGFVGEMSGYLADVCYTAEYPLLSRYPNLTPFKFVTNNPDTGEPEFIGSVLVFEVKSVGDKPSMLVRAFDVPHENEIDIASFIEQYLDKLAIVAKQRGITQILIPGNSGAMSNYQMTINYMRQTYTAGKSPVSLSERFAFNGYDLTNDCYVARIIE